MGSKPLILPRRLRSGSRVALIAPAGPLIDTDDIRRAEELCGALGYQPVVGSNAAARQGYLAGTDQQRLADLNAALGDAECDAVWCIRGGFGVTRILDGVDFDAARRDPKPVIGYSDITALLLALNRETGLITFHGPVARAPMPRFSREHFERVLARPEPAGVLGTLPVRPDVLVPRENRITTVSPGVAQGPLIGGNLTLLHCLVGTRWFPDLDGAVLFLEDVGEELYAIDRMLAHLRSVGSLSKLAGVVIGRFTEMKRSSGDGALGLEDVLRTYFEPLGVPAASGFPIGHIDDQWTIPIGVRARLDAGAGTLELLDRAVA